MNWLGFPLLPGKYFLMMFGVGLSLAIPVYLLNFEEKT